MIVILFAVIVLFLGFVMIVFFITGLVATVLSSDGKEKKKNDIRN